MNFSQALRITMVSCKNLILGGNIVAGSLINNPRLMIEYVSESLLLFRSLSSKRGIPQRNVFGILPADNIETIKLGNFITRDVWFFRSSLTSDIVSLCLICQIIKPKIVFEIGTMKGYTALHFALNTSDDAQIYTLDLPKNNNLKDVKVELKTTAADNEQINRYFECNDYCFKDCEVASKINCLYGDSATFDFSPFHGKADFFFIDGAHSYEYVRSDTLNALKCCHTGSVIAWHDFGRVGINGVRRFITELSRDYKIYSIYGGTLAFMKLE